MNTLKEQDGRYYQECKSIMLATKEDSNIFMNHENILEYSEIENIGFLSGCISQHLYITSDEEIKEDDWVVYKNKEIRQNIYGKIGSVIGSKDFLREHCKKIIATTDESLEPINLYGNSKLFKTKLPKPSDSFISKYIEEYNKDNIFTKILVEFVAPTAKDWNTLKVDSNNTITIKKVKDSYSREEVINLLYKYNDSIIDRYSQLTNKDLIKWIKENL